MAVSSNIIIDQGTNHTRIYPIQVLTNPSLPYHVTTNPWIALDLTGYTARMHVRKDYDALTPLISLVSPTDIVLGGANGKVTINFTPSMTDAIRFTGESIDLVFDLELVNGEQVKRPVQGLFTILRNVTHN